MNLLIRPGGEIVCVYAETIHLRCLGDVSIRRASHVEPDAAGQWWADLSPAGGPKLGPHPCRSQALLAEEEWLGRHLAQASG